MGVDAAIAPMIHHKLVRDWHGQNKATKLCQVLPKSSASQDKDSPWGKECFFSSQYLSSKINQKTYLMMGFKRDPLKICSIPISLNWYTNIKKSLSNKAKLRIGGPEKTERIFPAHRSSSQLILVNTFSSGCPSSVFLHHRCFIITLIEGRGFFGRHSKIIWRILLLPKKLVELGGTNPWQKFRHFDPYLNSPRSAQN